MVMETINDIVLEVATEMLNTSMHDITAEVIYGWATRLGDAATCKDSLQVGNAAKMFEVLKNIKQEAETTCEYREYPIAGAPGARGTCPVVDADWIIDECKSVLSAPARNCDRFISFDEAKKEFLCETGRMVVGEEMYDWLFAEAKGEKK
jgi:hypothetical protein